MINALIVKVKLLALKRKYWQSGKEWWQWKGRWLTVTTAVWVDRLADDNALVISSCLMNWSWDFGHSFPFHPKDGVSNLLHDRSHDNFLWDCHFVRKWCKSSHVGSIGITETTTVKDTVFPEWEERNKVSRLDVNVIKRGLGVSQTLSFHWLRQAFLPSVMLDVVVPFMIVMLLYFLQSSLVAWVSWVRLPVETTTVTHADWLIVDCWVLLFLLSSSRSQEDLQMNQYNLVLNKITRRLSSPFSWSLEWWFQWHSLWLLSLTDVVDKHSR